MSSTLLLPPREQLCNAVIKHTHMQRRLSLRFDKVRKRLGEVFVCVFLDECVDEVRGSSAPETGVVNRADLDEVFLEEDRQAPAGVFV